MKRRASIQRAERAGVGIDADCLGTRPDRGGNGGKPGDALLSPDTALGEKLERVACLSPPLYLPAPLLSLERPLLTRFLAYLETVME